MDILSLALAAKGGGSSAGGVIPDWNQNDETASDYIKNRPGGYTIPQPAIDIEWDGVIGDKVAVNFNGITLVKVSDEIPTKSQLIGANITVATDGSTRTNTITEETLHYDFENFIICGDLIFTICLVANSSLQGITFSESGVYFLYDSSSTYVSKIFAEDRELAIKISKDYLESTTIVLPETYSGGEPYRIYREWGKGVNVRSRLGDLALNVKYNSNRDILTGLFLDRTNLRFYTEGNNGSSSVSDTIVYLSKEHILNDIVIENTAHKLLNKSRSDVEVGDAFEVWIIYDEDNDALKTFSWCKCDDDTITEYKSRYFVMNGDKELILASSTANSTKRFKITVDDTCTISATEVT